MEDRKSVFFFIVFVFMFMSKAFSKDGWAPGKLTEFEVLNSKKKFYTYREACSSLQDIKNFERQQFLKNPSLLMEALDVNRLDCLGTPLLVQDFCRKKWQKDPGYMRGFIDLKDKKIICERGDRVSLRMDCGPGAAGASPDGLCQDSRLDCLKLKDLLSSNLNLFHHSLTSAQPKDPKSLNCHFVKEGLFDDKTLLKAIW